MKIFIGSDHAAFNEKSEIIKMLSDHEVVDLGTHSLESCSYSEYALKVARAVRDEKNSKGILICGSGIGVSIAANKIQDIRAARCLSVDDAQMSRKHNNSNIICLASRISSIDEMEEMIKFWLSTDFEQGRHQTRIESFNKLGELK